MKRRLFNILSAISLLVLMALVILWGRSYFAADEIFFEYPYARLTSDTGQVKLRYTYYPDGDGVYSHLLVFHYVPLQPHCWPPGYKLSQQVGVFGSYASCPRFDEWSFMMPHWLAILLAAVLPAWWLPRQRKRRERLSGGCCLNCGYDLRASKERCPECGTPIPAGGSPVGDGLKSQMKC